MFSPTIGEGQMVSLDANRIQNVQKLFGSGRTNVTIQADSSWDNQDMKREYEGKVLPLLSEVFKRELETTAYNSFVGHVAPLFYTSELNFQVEEMDYIMLPFEEVADGGPPLTTGHTRRKEFYKMKRYRRHRELTIEIVSDENFGAVRFLEEMRVLVDQGVMTLALGVAMAIIDVAWTNATYGSGRIGQDADRSIDHTIAIMNDRENFAVANKGSDRLNAAILSLARKVNKLDTIVSSQRLMQTIFDVAVDSLNKSPVYAPVKGQGGQDLEDSLARAMPDTRTQTSALVPLKVRSEGRTVSYLACPEFKRLRDDQNGYQPFVTRVTRGTLEPMPTSLEMFSTSRPCDWHSLATIMVEQHPNQLEHKPVKFSKQAAGCGLFYDRHAPPSADGSGSRGLLGGGRKYTPTTNRVESDEQLRLADWYTAGVEQHSMSGHHLDYYVDLHDTLDERPPEIYDSANELLDMVDYRHHDRLVTYNGDVERPAFFPPRKYGDFVMRALPSKYFVMGAQKVIKYYTDRTSRETVPDPWKDHPDAIKEWNFGGERVAHTHLTPAEYGSGMRRAKELLKYCNIKHSGSGSVIFDFASDPATMHAAAPESLLSGAPVRVTFSRARPDEPFEAYRSRLSAAAIQEASKKRGRLERPGESRLATFATHVPDEAHGDFLAFAHYVQGIENAGQREDIVDKATELISRPGISLTPKANSYVRKLALTVQEVSQPDVSAADAVKKLQAATKGPSTSEAIELSKHADIAKTASTRLATAIKTALPADAMDIDEPAHAGHLGRFVGTHGAGRGVYEKQTDEEEAFIELVFEARDRMYLDGKEAGHLDTNMPKNGIFLSKRIAEQFKQQPSEFLRRMWSVRLETLQNEGDPFVYCTALLLMLADHSIHNVERLEESGVAFFRINALRGFQQYGMAMIVGMERGSSTCETAFGHAQIIPSIHNVENRLQVIGQFHFGVVFRKRRNVAILLNAACEAFYGGLNTDNCTTVAQFNIKDPQNKPSNIPMPVPLTEDAYVYPLHLDNEPLSMFPDIRAADPKRKHSMTDRFRQRFGNVVQKMWSAIRNATNVYQYPAFSPIFERGTVAHYGSNSMQRPILIEGTGFRASIGMNVPGADKVFNGSQGRFMENAPREAVMVY